MSSPNTQVAKQRESGIELFRIIAMLLIVAHHYVVNSGVTQLLEGGGIVKICFIIFLACGEKQV